MLSNNTNVLELCYDNITVSAAQDVMEAALAGVKTYCEQCYNTVNCTYSTNGTLTLTFSAADAGDRILTYRDAAMDAAIAVHDQLWESGALNASMSDYEKARVYYAWICDNCVYDYGAGDHSLSHIAYSLFENGTAVCDGYTGAYNMLLKLEGIDCTALSNSSHIWTVADPGRHGISHRHHLGGQRSHPELRLFCHDPRGLPAAPQLVIRICAAPPAQCRRRQLVEKSFRQAEQVFRTSEKF